MLVWAELFKRKTKFNLATSIGYAINKLTQTMVLGVAGLIWRIKVCRESSHKKDAIVKEQRITINNLIAKSGEK